MSPGKWPEQRQGRSVPRIYNDSRRNTVDAARNSWEGAGKGRARSKRWRTGRRRGEGNRARIDINKGRKPFENRITDYPVQSWEAELRSYFREDNYACAEISQADGANR